MWGRLSSFGQNLTELTKDLALNDDDYDSDDSDGGSSEPAQQQQQQQQQRQAQQTAAAVAATAQPVTNKIFSQSQNALGQLFSGANAEGSQPVIAAAATQAQAQAQALQPQQSLRELQDRLEAAERSNMLITQEYQHLLKEKQSECDSLRQKLLTSENQLCSAQQKLVDAERQRRAAEDEWHTQISDFQKRLDDREASVSSLELQIKQLKRRKTAAADSTPVLSQASSAVNLTSQMTQSMTQLQGNMTMVKECQDLLLRLRPVSEEASEQASEQPAAEPLPSLSPQQFLDEFNKRFETLENDLRAVYSGTMTSQPAQAAAEPAAAAGESSLVAALHDLQDLIASQLDQSKQQNDDTQAAIAPAELARQLHEDLQSLLRQNATKLADLQQQIRTQKRQIDDTNRKFENLFSGVGEQLRKFGALLAQNGTSEASSDADASQALINALSEQLKAKVQMQNTVDAILSILEGTTAPATATANADEQVLSRVRRFTDRLRNMTNENDVLASKIKKLEVDAHSVERLTAQLADARAAAHMQHSSSSSRLVELQELLDQKEIEHEQHSRLLSEQLVELRSACESSQRAMLEMRARHAEALAQSDASSSQFKQQMESMAKEASKARELEESLVSLEAVLATFQVNYESDVKRLNEKIEDAQKLIKQKDEQLAESATQLSEALAAAAQARSHTPVGTPRTLGGSPASAPLTLLSSSHPQASETEELKLKLEIMKRALEDAMGRVNDDTFVDRRLVSRLLQAYFEQGIGANGDHSSAKILEMITKVLRMKDAEAKVLKTTIRNYMLAQTASSGTSGSFWSFSRGKSTTSQPALPHQRIVPGQTLGELWMQFLLENTERQPSSQQPPS